MSIVSLNYFITLSFSPNSLPRSLLLEQCLCQGCSYMLFLRSCFQLLYFYFCFLSKQAMILSWTILSTFSIASGVQVMMCSISFLLIARFNFFSTFSKKILNMYNRSWEYRLIRKSIRFTIESVPVIIFLGGRVSRLVVMLLDQPRKEIVQNLSHQHYHIQSRINYAAWQSQSDVPPSAKSRVMFFLGLERGISSTQLQTSSSYSLLIGGASMVLSQSFIKFAYLFIMIYNKNINMQKNNKKYDIFIVGTTAVGKTKLSLALGQHPAFEAEIISCDSMQLYRHADIMTAKATPDQQKLVKHNMIDMLDLSETGYNRNKYYEYCQSMRQKLHDQNKIPIVIGGTNYYIQTLLYNIDIQDSPPAVQTIQDQDTLAQLKQQSETVSKMSPRQKYDYLKNIDPQICKKVHPNDQHRVGSYLNKYFSTGIRPSQSHIEYTDDLRNPDSILFWIRNSDRTELKSLMQTRINSMTDLAGISQIISVFHCVSKSKNEIGGVLQSIGYKEFQKLVAHIGLQIPEDRKSFEQVHKWVSQSLSEIDPETYGNVLEDCRKVLLTSTFQYSKRQVTWIKNRLFKTPQNNDHFFVLQLAGEGDLQERFKSQVLDKAMHILESIFEHGFGSVTGGLSSEEKDLYSKKKQKQKQKANRKQHRQQLKQIGKKQNNDAQAEDLVAKYQQSSQEEQVRQTKE